MRWVPLLVTAILGLSSCYSFGYYAQSVTGELELLAKRRPIASLVKTSRTPPELKRKLATVLRLRAFATEELGLPDNPSYLSYAHIDRKFVVWNVFATPEFSLGPVKWCFPLIGCTSYLGYFSEDRARVSASELAEQGHDVYVGGVTAYSTLGWFDDPVLSTMLRWDDAQIATFVIHELAHQALYVRDDTAFNEAFATTVARQGVRRWLAQSGTPQARAALDQQQTRENEFVFLVLGARKRLERLYASSLQEAAMRVDKALIFEELKRDYAALRSKWGNDTGYDAWIQNGLNNAKISSVATYHEHEQAFEALFQAAGASFDEFFRLAGKIGNLDKAKRSACLRELAQAEHKVVTNCPSVIATRVAGNHLARREPPHLSYEQL